MSYIYKYITHHIGMSKPYKDSSLAQEKYIISTTCSKKNDGYPNKRNA